MKQDTIKVAEKLYYMGILWIYHEEKDGNLAEQIVKQVGQQLSRDDLIFLHMELQTQFLAEIVTQLRKTEVVDPDTAIAAFAGWLTSRKEVSGPFSSHHEAGSMAQLFKRFCEAQGWKADDERFHRQIEELKKRYPDE